MSSATTHPPLVPFPPDSTSPRPVPSLEKLYEMTSVPDERVVIPSVDWAFYEQLVDSIPEGANIHVDYDGKDLEIMSLSQLHDGIKKRLGRFVELTAEELEIPCTGLGQATWKRPEVTRGLEADECYYFAPEKLAAAAEAMMRMSMDGADVPQSRPRDRGRPLSVQDRPAGHLCRLARRRSLAVRRRAPVDHH